MIDLFSDAWRYFWGIFFLVWAFAGIAGALLVVWLSVNWNIRNRNR